MVPYLILFSIVLLSAKLQDKIKNKDLFIKVALFSIFFISLFSGFRNIGIGTDTAVYVEPYFKMAKSCESLISNIKLNGENLDKGFLILNYIASFFSNKIWISLFYIEFCIISLLYLGIYKSLQYNKYSIVIFMTLYLFIFYTQSLNYMRQFCAMSFLFSGFFSYIRNKKIKYFIYQCIAYSFHSSSILFIFVPLIWEISNLNNKKTKKIILAVILVSLAIGVLAFYFLLDYVTSLNLINDIYNDRYGTDSNYSGIDKIPKTELLIIIFSYLLIYISIKKKILSQNLNYFAFTIHTCYFITYLTIYYVAYISRMSYYFLSIDMWILALILSNKQLPKIIKYSFFILVIASWYYTYMVLNSCETYPYQSDILGI